MRSYRLKLVLAAALASAGIAAACSSQPESPVEPSGGDAGVDATLPSDAEDETPFSIDATPIDPDAAALAIEPVDQVLDVTVGGAPPTIAYIAKASGSPVAVAWSIDRGELGKIDLSTGVFTPSGNIGGKATITATYGSKKAT